MSEMAVRAVVDVTTTDHIVGDNDVEIKIVRDEDGEVGVIFAVEDVIVRLTPIHDLLSYLNYLILEEAQNLREKETPKPTWRGRNKDDSYSPV